MGSEFPLSVSDSAIVECFQGDTIYLQSGSNNCRIDRFQQAAFNVFLLQADPIDGIS